MQGRVQGRKYSEEELIVIASVSNTLHSVCVCVCVCVCGNGNIKPRTLLLTTRSHFHTNTHTDTYFVTLNSAQ
jgi:hypothetical protein